MTPEDIARFKADFEARTGKDVEAATFDDLRAYGEQLKRAEATSIAALDQVSAAVRERQRKEQ